MTESLVLSFVVIVCWVGPSLAAVGWSWCLRFPRNAILRGTFAVLLGWLLSVALHSFAYNPAAIALAHANGEHFPEARFDNNVVAVQILTGWLLPALSVIGVACVRHLMRRMQHGRPEPLADRT